jgi:hypothetical protein
MREKRADYFACGTRVVGDVDLQSETVVVIVSRPVFTSLRKVKMSFRFQIPPSRHRFLLAYDEYAR